MLLRTPLRHLRSLPLIEQALGHTLLDCGVVGKSLLVDRVGGLKLIVPPCAAFDVFFLVDALLP